MSSQPSRAASVVELDDPDIRLFTVESRRRDLAFDPRPADAIDPPHAKFGTT